MKQMIHISRRHKQDGYVLIDESASTPGRMFISTPNILELTEKQAINLANAIIDHAEQIWN